MARLHVGDTPLRQSIQLCGRCGGADVRILDESRNRFGTFKDRRNAALLDGCAERKNLVLVQITTGNSGYSLGMMAKEEEEERGVKRTVVNVVPRGISKEIREKLEECSMVEEMDLRKKEVTPKELYDIAQRRSKHTGPAGDIIGVESYGLAGGYRAMIGEIAKKVKPTHIFCPVGEGELAVELAMACGQIWKDDPPKIIGVTIKENVLVRKEDRGAPQRPGAPKAFGLDEAFLRNPGKSVADKLVNAYSKFKALVDSLRAMGRLELMVVSDRKIAKEYRYLKKIGIDAEPSAAAAFCGAEAYGLKEGDVAVIINTGKGLYDKKAVDRAWLRRLKKAVIGTAIFIAGTLTALGIVGYNAVHNRETSSRLHSEAYLYGNKECKIDYFKYSDVMSDVCQFVKTERLDHWPPTDSEEKEIGEKCKYGLGVTSAELRFYIDYRKAETSGNMIDQMMRNLEKRYPNFNPDELEFYIDYKRADSNGDMMGREMMRDYERRFKRGEYDSAISKFRSKHQGTWYNEAKSIFDYYRYGY